MTRTTAGTPELQQTRSSWPLVKFGDVVRNVKVKVDPKTSGLSRYIAGEHMNSDDLHIRQWGTVEDGYLGPAFHNKFVKGQVLYGSRRTYLKKVAVAPFDGITANTTFVLEPKDDRLIPELLPFIMQTDAFNEHSIRESKGSVNPYILWKDIAWYTFPLPPKDEQRRIAEILWGADEVVEHFLETGEQSKRMRQAYVNNELLLNLSQDDLKSLPTLPDEWQIVSLRDCLSPVNGTSEPPHVHSIYLGLEHIPPGSYSAKEYGNGADARSVCSVFKQGHLLYGKLRPYLDKCIIAESEGVCTTELLVLQASDITFNEYVIHHLHSSQFLDYASANVFGSRMPRTSMHVIGDYKIPLPPIERQCLLNKKVMSIVDMERQITGHVAALRNMKSCLLHRIG